MSTENTNDPWPMNRPPWEIQSPSQDSISAGMAALGIRSLAFDPVAATNALAQDNSTTIFAGERTSPNIVRYTLSDNLISWNCCHCNKQIRAQVKSSCISCGKPLKVRNRKIDGQPFVGCTG